MYLHSKISNERYHAKKRAKERFDLSLNRHDLNRIILMIQSGDATFFDRQSNNRTRWIINLDGNEALAVYDKQRKQIITFLELKYTLPIDKYNPFVQGSKQHKAYELGKRKQHDIDQCIYQRAMEETKRKLVNDRT